MLDYLKKFNDLPVGLRQKVANKTAVATIEALESKYQLALATLIMRVMVKEIAPKNLAPYLLKQGLVETAAEQLAHELKEKIFFSVTDYLSAVEAGPAIAQRGGKQAVSAAEVVAPAVLSKPPAGAADALSEEALVKLDGAAAKQSNQAKPDSESLVRGVNFFFSADDEAEIKELTRRIDLAKKIELPEATMEEKLKTIINHAQINFGSADLSERFKQILKTYLRGIRDKVEAKMTLIKSFSSGGLSFDDDSAQKVMDMTDKVLNSRPGEIVIPLPKIKVSVPSRDVPYDFSGLIKKEEKKPVSAVGAAAANGPGPKSSSVPGLAQIAPLAVKPPPPELANQELAPLPPMEVKPLVRKVAIAAPEKKAAWPEAKNRIKTAAKRPSADLGSMPLVRPRPQAGSSTTGQKVKVEDVKYVPRVMSPLDEIRYMDLIGFHRLDKDPVAAAGKIKNEIDLLAEESYGKKLEGIKLWRVSPVNRLYLEMGHKGISENKAVDAIIEERKARGEDYLTVAEFKAIMDLNKSLRF